MSRFNCTRLSSVVASLLASALTLSVGCDTSNNPPPPRPAEKFTFSVTSSVKPKVESIEDANGNPRPVAAYSDRNGVQSDFVANEVLFAPTDKADLDAFMVKYQGEIISDDRVPYPDGGSPGSPKKPISPAHQKLIDTAEFYLVKLNKLPAVAELQAAGDLRQMQGSYQFSGEDAGRLIALTAFESTATDSKAQRRVTPNFVLQPTAMLHQTTEGAPTAGAALNLFNQSYVKSSGYGSNRSTVGAAWQYMTLHGYSPFSVNVAIIDGGFWLGTDPATGFGIPNTPTQWGTDIAYIGGQYDFLGDTYNAGGTNPGKCTGGNTCNWHGNQSTGTATGLVNNSSGAGGSGGLVATPILFKIDFTTATLRRAIKSLPVWGIQVASMSFGGACNEDCQDYKDCKHLYDYFNDARNAGIVMVAAAGNDNVDSAAGNYEPCMVGGVICVGAMNDGQNTRISYSNFGGGIDIWAPTNIASMPNGDNPAKLANAGGTSAATPWVAGVVAMMKSLNPSLTSDQVDAILKKSAWKDSTDVDVKGVGYLNALGALKEVAGEKLADDDLEPNDWDAQATTINSSGVIEKMLTAKNQDFYKFTVSDYSSVSVGVEYMSGLGNIKMTFQRDGKDYFPTEFKSNSTVAGQNYSGLFAPGTYVIRVQAWSQLNYNLTFSSFASGLYPDMFEDNNVWASASNVSAGEWELNFHQLGDQDWFVFTVPPTVGIVSQYGVSIAPTDFDTVDLEVYSGVTDSFGTKLTKVDEKSGTAYPGAKMTTLFTDPSELGKSFFIKISSSAKTRYTLYVGAHVNQSLFPKFVATRDDPFTWHNPGDPWDGIMPGPDDWFGIEGSDRFGSIVAHTPGITLEAVDKFGSVIAKQESISMPNIEMQQFGFLDLAGKLSAGEPYLIHVTRTEFTDMVTQLSSVMSDVDALATAKAASWAPMAYRLSAQ